MPTRFGENVMVHCTDIVDGVGRRGRLAGLRATVPSSGGSSGEKKLSATRTCSYRRRFVTAIPDHAVHFSNRLARSSVDQNTAKAATTSWPNKHDSKGGYRWLFKHDISVAVPRWRWPPY
jgi:hypothetical protein